MSEVFEPVWTIAWSYPPGGTRDKQWLWGKVFGTRSAAYDYALKFLIREDRQTTRGNDIRKLRRQGIRVQRGAIVAHVVP